jgi:hypothetical protein
MLKKKRQGKDHHKYLLSVIFILMGTGFLFYALTTPCQVDSITTVVEKAGITGLVAGDLDKEIAMELPPQVQRAVCIYTDFDTLVVFLIGAALTTSATSAIVRKATS